MRNNVNKSKSLFKARGVKPNTKVFLFAKAAGRCEICNELIVKDKITTKDVIWGEMAHIYAFSDGGPRSQKGKLFLNDADNLILTCPSCHEKIDKGELVVYYPVEYLKQLKKDHERRIKLVTSLGNNRTTKVLKMAANINDEVVKISQHEIVEALLKEKLFSCEDNPEEIDFTNTSGIDNSIYWKSKKQEIDDVICRFYGDLRRNNLKYVSVFPMGPIPLLVHLGYKLENKINTRIFQRHRDGENWIWKKTKSDTEYKIRSNEGKDESRVALLLSLSGFVDRSLLPKVMNSDYFIYEIYIKNPNYNFLRTENDLYMFERFFTTKISEIKNRHKNLKVIDLFPAVPAPVAVVCGRSLNKNSDPKLKIYNLKNKKVFKYALTIN